MSMRTSSLAAFHKSVFSLQERKRKLDETQEQIDNQKRVLRPGDDPLAAARAERARAKISSSEAQQRSLQASRNAMTQTESALGSAGELVSDASAALLSAGNGIFTDADRGVVAEKLQNLRDQLLSLANSEDGSGNFVFGGQGASAPPFANTSSGVAFNGTSGEQSAAGAEGLLLAVDGATAWRKPDGNGFFKTSNAGSTTAYVDAGQVIDPATFFANTSPPAVADPAALRYQVQFSDVAGVTNYTVIKDGTPMGAAQPWGASGPAKAVQFDGMSVSIGGTPMAGDLFEVRLSQPTSLFTTLDTAIASLRTPGLTSAQVSQTVQDGMSSLAGWSESLSALRSRVGEALLHIDQVENVNDSAKLQAQVVRSDAEDLDPVAALADMQLQNTNYGIALKTYASVQRLSMFDYIGG